MSWVLQEVMKGCQGQGFQLIFPTAILPIKEQKNPHNFLSELFLWVIIDLGFWVCLSSQPCLILPNKGLVSSLLEFAHEFF
jgi:hypothetical protein